MIRPTIRRRSQPQVFTSRFVGGSLVSQWVRDERLYVVPSGTPGRVGEILDKMNLGSIQYTPVPWQPPNDYEWYAEKKIPEDQRVAYIKKCENWYSEHPQSNKLLKVKEPVTYNCELLSEFWFKKSGMPPLEDRVSAMRKADVPEELVQKHIKWDQKMDDTSEIRQKAIDEVFSMYAKSKTTPKLKVKEKLIKPVKKKMSK